MSEKVKITQDQADAIEWLQKDEGGEVGWEQGRLIKSHAKDINDWHDEAIALRGMPLLTLVDALRIGYEIVPAYKVGDWVARIDGAKFYPRGNVRIVQIKRIRISTADDKERAYYGEDARWGITFSSLRHATPEEIKTEKNRQTWRKLDRSVGEFKIGDVYNLRNHPGSSFLIKDEETLRWATENYINGDVSGIYPAEEFINFEDGDGIEFNK